MQAAHLENGLPSLWVGFTDEGMADANVDPKVQQLLTQLCIPRSTPAPPGLLCLPICQAIGLAQGVGTIGLQQGVQAWSLVPGKISLIWLNARRDLLQHCQCAYCHHGNFQIWRTCRSLTQLVQEPLSVTGARASLFLCHSKCAQKYLW